jgi:tetratricopeptide (TPR) repeat protein
MRYEINAEWNGQNDTLTLDEDGIFYVAYCEGGLRCFRKPTQQEHVIVIASRGSCFAISGEEAVCLNDTSAVRVGGLSLRLVPNAGGLHNIYDRAEDLRQRFGMSRKRAAIGVAVLVVVAFMALYLGRDTSVPIDDLSGSHVSERSEGDRGRSLADMRLKLAEKALAQGRHDKALGLVAKVLHLYPQDKAALALRESALKEKESHRALTQENIALEMWAKKLVGEAGELISAGDLVGARFKLSEVLTRNAEHAEALEMLAKIDEKTHEEANALEGWQEHVQDLVERAKKQFAAARDHAAKEQWREAYGELKQARSMLDESGAHPDFEIDFNDLYSDAESRMARQASELRDRATERIRQAGLAKGAQEQARLYRLALEDMDEIGTFYDVMDVSGMQKQAIEALNELLKPLYVEAITLQELEGCCYAEAKLKHIREMAHYPEVEYSRMAAEAMNRCPCKR